MRKACSAKIAVIEINGSVGPPSRMTKPKRRHHRDGQEIDNRANVASIIISKGGESRRQLSGNLCVDFYRRMPAA